MRNVLNRAVASVWPHRFWEHLIRDDADFHRHVDYIHLNPVRHGYVLAPSEWKYSTFHEWVGRGHYDINWGSGGLPELPDWAMAHE